MNLRQYVVRPRSETVSVFLFHSISCVATRFGSLESCLPFVLCACSTGACHLCSMDLLPQDPEILLGFWLAGLEAADDNGLERVSR